MQQGFKQPIDKIMKHNTLEFNLFVYGDSSDINTWSNLPYFFSKFLINKGIKLNRININPDESLLCRGYLNFLKKWITIKRKVIKKKFRFDPFRDKIITFLVNQKIKNENQKYPHANLNIFLTYSFSSYKFSNVPVVHYCDQTYEIFINDTKKETKKRDFYFIKIERNNLKNSAHIFSTNPKCAKFIIKRYNLSNVTELRAGIHLENSFTENENHILTLKKKNKDILCIGKDAYKRGVDILIEAFNHFNCLNANSFTLHLVGVFQKNIAEVNEKIIFYGYLNKNNPSEFKIYCDLLKKSRLFVMPMRFGPRPGVVKEAGLMYTPVITTNIWHMNELIQDNENGILVDSLNPRDFADKMNHLVNNEAIWEKLAKKAHQLAKEKYSWENTINHFLNVCSKYI